jgi:hypothetical protein
VRRRNPPIGSDSTLSGHTVHLGEDDRYVLPEMEASVKRAAGEPTGGKRYPNLDPVTGEILGWGGSKTLKRGHKRSCRCVGCSPATRARGMAALRRRAGGHSAGSRRNAQPARPPVKPSRTALEQIARRAGQDAGNRSMRKAGRKQWSQADWNAATREFHRVLGTDLAEGNPRLSAKASAFISRHVRKHIRKDRMPPRRAVRAAYEEARGKGLKVPKAPTPLRSVGLIPGTLTRVEYRRVGKHPGRYYHNFGPRVKAYALADGSILLKGPRRLFVRQ